ncbi:superoxide dismutase family protein [Oceaniglobus trochenteri]|uniref:superoxide dismutase family protein n=1 Tax=Oceaniglobus trochenteri TaxID=2763260 RepID=UPI001CFFA73C|nr:superoxide dismutase family protein [Oceaniglobus trochenteri]
MKLPLMTTAALLMASGALAADATATMQGPDGTDMGQVSLTQTPHGVLIEADLKGVAPGGHGFHIHETGSCSPGFDAAGDHYNPAGAEHGILNASGRHAGDLPNVFAAEDGTARADILTDTVSLDPGADSSLFDDDGAAIILHENPDSYGPEAGAGGRLACGVITMN